MHGFKTLFRAGIAMLAHGEAEITRMPFERILQYIHDLPKNFLLLEKPSEQSKVPVSKSRSASSTVDESIGGEGDGRKGEGEEEKKLGGEAEGDSTGGMRVRLLSEEDRRERSGTEEEAMRREKPIFDVRGVLRRTGVKSLLLERLEREYQDSHKKAAKAF